jgi:hypothetical protein
MAKKNFIVSPLFFATAFGVVLGFMLAYLFSFSHQRIAIESSNIGTTALQEHPPLLSQ